VSLLTLDLILTPCTPNFGNFVCGHFVSLDVCQTLLSAYGEYESPMAISLAEIYPEAIELRVTIRSRGESN